jgi:hypothetical protein
MITLNCLLSRFLPVSLIVVATTSGLLLGSNQLLPDSIGARNPAKPKKNKTKQIKEGKIFLDKRHHW